MTRNEPSIESFKQEPRNDQSCFHYLWYQVVDNRAAMKWQWKPDMSVLKWLWTKSWPHFIQIIQKPDSSLDFKWQNKNGIQQFNNIIQNSAQNSSFQMVNHSTTHLQNVPLSNYSVFEGSNYGSNCTSRWPEDNVRAAKEWCIIRKEKPSEIVEQNRIIWLAVASFFLTSGEQSKMTLYNWGSFYVAA